MENIYDINKAIQELKNMNQNIKDVSDGHHTFGDYIDMRNNLFIALCNAYSDISWKSKKHYDEENDPMFNGDFIAGINSDTGMITFHLKMKFWDDLNVEEIDRAPKYDNYTSQDVIERIYALNNNQNEPLKR